MGSLIVSADQEWPRVVVSGQGAAKMPDDHHLVVSGGWWLCNGMGKESNCVASYKCGRTVAEDDAKWENIGTLWTFGDIVKTDYSNHNYPICSSPSARCDEKDPWHLSSSLRIPKELPILLSRCLDVVPGVIIPPLIPPRWISQHLPHLLVHCRCHHW